MVIKKSVEAWSDLSRAMIRLSSPLWNPVQILLKSSMALLPLFQIGERSLDWSKIILIQKIWEAGRVAVKLQVFAYKLCLSTCFRKISLFIALQICKSHFYRESEGMSEAYALCRTSANCIKICSWPKNATDYKHDSCSCNFFLHSGYTFFFCSYSTTIIEMYHFTPIHPGMYENCNRFQ